MSPSHVTFGAALKDNSDLQTEFIPKLDNDSTEDEKKESNVLKKYAKMGDIEPFEKNLEDADSFLTALAIVSPHIHQVDRALILSKTNGDVLEYTLSKKMLVESTRAVMAFSTDDKKDAEFPEKILINLLHKKESEETKPFSFKLLGTVKYYDNKETLHVAVYYRPGWPIKKIGILGVILILVIVVAALCLRRNKNDDEDEEEDEEDIEAIRGKKNQGTSGGTPLSSKKDSKN